MCAFISVSIVDVPALVPVSVIVFLYVIVHANSKMNLIAYGNKAEFSTPTIFQNILTIDAICNLHQLCPRSCHAICHDI